MHTNEINIRDPYILLHDGYYYLYGTRSETCWGTAYGFDCYKSQDMENWEGPIEIFRRQEDFFATENFWAPECYYHNGSFYLITTFGGSGMKKGIYILRSDQPDGKFTLYGERLTPKEWDCIDAALFFEDDHIYMLYSHSFEDISDADICIQELKNDLSAPKTDPVVLFAAKEAPWARPVPFAKAEFGIEGEVYFSDGPCAFRVEDKKLYLTWSSWSEGSYAVGLAVSDSGGIYGPWKQQEIPLWPKNGGHGMVFKDFAGKWYFVLHYPNDRLKEHPCFKQMIIDGDTFRLED